MLKLRLHRVGGKKEPSYRIVAVESTTSRSGKVVEVVGFYNPRTQPETVQLKEERLLHWLSVGAQPSESLARLLEKSGTLGRFARLKAGEPLEALVAEAETAAAGVKISPKTQVGPVARSEKAAPTE